MLNSNLKNKISLMSVLFSLVFLFAAVNFGLCCSASYSDDNDTQQENTIVDYDEIFKPDIDIEEIEEEDYDPDDNDANDQNVDLTKSEKHVTFEPINEENDEANDSIDTPAENEDENENVQTEEEERNENSSSTSRFGDLCPFLCNIF